MHVNIGDLYARAADEGRLIEASLTTYTATDADTEATRSQAQVILPTRAMLERSSVSDAEPPAHANSVVVNPGNAVVCGTGEGGMWFVPVDPAVPDGGTHGTGLGDCVVSLRDSAALRTVHGQDPAAEPRDVPLFCTMTVPGIGDDPSAMNARLLVEAHAWLHTQSARTALDPDVRYRLATALHDLAGEVIAAHPDSQTWHQAHAHIGVTAAYADAPLPDGIERYTEARLIAHHIARYEPGHELAAAPTTDLADILTERGAGEVSAEAGAWVRRATGVGPAEAARKVLHANDALCRQVFAPLTRTSIEDLAVSLLSIDGCDRAAEAFDARGESLSGDWVDAALRRVDDVISRALPADYQYDLSLAAANGRDVLLVREPAAAEGVGPGGVAGLGPAPSFGYAYSWPTRDRRELLELAGEDPLPTVSPEEIPPPQSLAEMRVALDEVLDRHLEPDIDPDEELPAPAPV